MITFGTIDFVFDIATIITIFISIYIFIHTTRKEKKNRFQNEKITKSGEMLARLKKEHISPLTSISYRRVYKRTDRDKLTPMLFSIKSFFDNELLPVFFVFSTKDNIEEILKIRDNITELGNDNLSSEYNKCLKEKDVKKTEFLPPTKGGKRDPFADILKHMYGSDWDDIEKMKEKYLTYLDSEKMQDIVKKSLKEVQKLEEKIIMKLRQNIYGESEDEIKEMKKLYSKSIYR